MIDPFTLKHLRAWLLKQVEDEDRRERVEVAMLAVVSEDPTYWGGKSWWEVYDRIGGHGFGIYPTTSHDGASIVHSATLDGLSGVTCAPLGPYRWADISLCLRRTGKRKDRPVISDATALARFVADEVPGLADESKEHVLVIPVDIKNRALGIAHVSTGSLSSSIVHPRDVMQVVLAVPAAAFFLVHNHPSGEAVLSNEDRQLSERLDAAAKIMGISLLDLLAMAPQEDGGWAWEGTKSYEHGVVFRRDAEGFDIETKPDDEVGWKDNADPWKDNAGRIFCNKCDSRHKPGKHDSVMKDLSSKG